MNGCKSDYFDIYQGVAQGCTLSPTLFLIFIDGLMKENKRTVPSLPSLELNGLLFADDFVGLSNSEQGLQALIDVVYAYSKKWRHWDAHLKDLVTSGKRKLNILLRILCNPSISLYLRRQVILPILRPSLEYGNKVWRCTSTQSKSIRCSVVIGACKKILSCSSKTCNEAV